MFFSNAGSFLILKVLQFYLKLSYPIEKLFLFPAGFELRILVLAFDADTITNWTIAHSESLELDTYLSRESSKPERYVMGFF